MASVLRDYRVILRHVRQLPSGDAMKQHVSRSFKRGMALGKKERKVARETAHAYATTISSIRELAFLRGLDTGDKMAQSELVSSMAKRVGLEVPKPYQEGDEAEELSVK